MIVKINSKSFDIPRRYHAGVCNLSEAEALALESLRLDAIRGNLAKREVALGERLLVEEVLAYAEEYRLEVSSRRALSPIDVEVRRLAEAEVLRGGGDPLGAEWDAKVAKAEGAPGLREMAERSLEIRRGIVQAGIDELVG